MSKESTWRQDGHKEFGAALFYIKYGFAAVVVRDLHVGLIGCGPLFCMHMTDEVSRAMCMRIWKLVADAGRTPPRISYVKQCETAHWSALNQGHVPGNVEALLGAEPSCQCRPAEVDTCFGEAPEVVIK